MTTGRKVILAIALSPFAVQLIPYGWSHTNPPVTAEPKWDSEQTRTLAKRACFDCHSNETRWPWYSHVAPVSWLVQNDVDGGRRHLNFSEWDRPQRHGADAAKEIERGAMPPKVFLPMHPEARLSDQEKDQLKRGMIAMFGSDSKTRD